jgi:hypothetical protein
MTGEKNSTAHEREEKKICEKHNEQADGEDKKSPYMHVYNPTYHHQRTHTMVELSHP